jgi:hypothetical protein
VKTRPRGDRLHEWLGEPFSEFPHFDPPGLSDQVFAELMTTGAVVISRKTSTIPVTITACRSSCLRVAPRQRHRAAGSTMCPTPQVRWQVVDWRRCEQAGRSALREPGRRAGSSFIGPEVTVATSAPLAGLSRDLMTCHIGGGHGVD